MSLIDFRYFCFVGMKSIWLVLELLYNFIMYSWGCFIFVCILIFFYVLLMVIYFLFVRWLVGLYILRSRNKNLCCVRFVFFNCVRSLLRFLFVFISLRMISFFLSFVGVSLLLWMNNVCLCWLVIVICKIMEIVNVNVKGGN